MALRLVQVDVAPDLADEATGMLREAGATQVWSSSGGSFGAIVSAVMGAERTGRAVDLLHERLSTKGGVRGLVLPLDAVLPRPAASLGQEAHRLERVSAAAVSREEVYANVAGNASLSATFVVMIVLATIVAAIGLTQDNTAAVIGAMVVAPLLGPNMALALGLTLGDRPLVTTAAQSGLVGLMLTFVVAMALGLWLDVDPSIRELSSRTTASVGDIVLALAAGAAGTLAYTTGAPTYLVGVMVAVALLPPTVASGLFLGNGFASESLGAALLTATNSVALVLASMLTFLARGMRPRAWWKEEQARRSTRWGAVILVALLVLLSSLILLSSTVLEPKAPT